MAEKTEVPGIYKVCEGVLVNKDVDALKAYKKRKQKEKRIDNLEKEMTDIKNSLSTIEKLLMGLIK